MKYTLILSGLLAFSSCGEAKKEEPVMIKKVVCADSVEQALFDENNNLYTVRMPGKCDTILVPAPEH